MRTIFLRGLLPAFLSVCASAQIVVYHEVTTVEKGTSRQFTAYVPLSPNTVTWAVNGVMGGNSTYGTVTQTGLYSAPAVIPAANVVAVQARSTAYPAIVGAARVTILQPQPWVWSVSPGSPAAGVAVTLSLNGSAFVSAATVLVNDAPWPTTYVSATQLRASGTFAAGGTYRVTVAHPNPGATVSQPVNVAVAGAPAVTVSPATATVSLGGTRQFSSNTSGVLWTSSAGSISASGLFTAPSTMPASSTVTVRATSSTDATKFAQATVTLQALPEVTVSPSAATVTLGGTQQFTSNTAVNWTATAGSITVNGLYTAPTTMPASSTVTIRATSSTDATRFAQATVTLQALPPAVTVSPSTVTVTLGGMQQFTANTSGVNWTASAGSISASGLFTAPSTMPASSTVTIRATSSTDATRFAQATVTLQALPPAVTVSPSSVTVILGGTQQFTSNTTGVNWTASAGSISAGGLFTAPSTMPASATVTIRATSSTDATRFAQAVATLQAAPQPTAPAYTAAARLLEQAAFGPTPQAIADVMQTGVNTWIDEQFALPETAIPIPSSGMAGVSAQTLNRLSTATDQLRQRVAWALGQIIVISANKNVYPEEYVPYQQLLSKHAFGNYRNLLKDIAISPQMGKYLDLANSNKPGLNGGANENFPRELLQLFSVGLVELNLDGTPRLNAGGQPIPAYTQSDVRQFALALTGWTYPTAAGSQPGSNNWENFSAPQMEPRPNNHDTTAKALLNGAVLPAGQTPMQDLDGVIDNVFQHPNTGPFVSLRLIRNLVTSNPSAGYIQRVAQVFNNNGAGVRGDLRAVVKAILTDPEARNDTPTATGGRLKDPVYLYVSFVRALNGRIAANTQIAWVFSNMGQPISSPPSVFGYYSPLYRTPSNPALYGPEFQIYTPTESVLLGNEIHQMLSSPGGDPTIDLTPFNAVAGNAAQLLDAVDQRLFYGRMTPALRAALTKAMAPSYDNNQRVRTALFLSALSGQYAVQY